jgi:hypothetical protein
MAILGRGRKRDVTPEFAEVEAAEAAGDIPALKRLLRASDSMSARQRSPLSVWDFSESLSRAIA